MHGSRGGTGGPIPPPLKNHKNIGFPSNTGPDPLKITKLPSQHSVLGHHPHASPMAFRWQADDGPVIVVFGSSLPSSTKKKKVIKVGPLLTKLSGSAYAMVLMVVNTIWTSDFLSIKCNFLIDPMYTNEFFHLI